jgi:hypothetical protein
VDATCAISSLSTGALTRCRFRPRTKQRFPVRLILKNLLYKNTTRPSLGWVATAILSNIGKYCQCWRAMLSWRPGFRSFP